MTDYPALCAQLSALIDGVPYRIANYANASALLYETLPELNWAGFYFREGNALILGPFQGRPACIRIPWGKGVCGAAAAQDATQRVEDVHAFPGHIACDSASNAEIVIPLRQNGRVIGVMDLDSPFYSRFDENDQAGLEEFARILENALILED